MAKKGTKLTNAQKQKMKEGRMASKNAKPAQILAEKPILHVTGQEIDGFDYWPAIRNSLRPLHQYVLCRAIEREVADKQIWQNKGIVLNILAKYFVVEVKIGKVKKVRAPFNREPMTEEHKQKMREGRQKKTAMV